MGLADFIVRLGLDSSRFHKGTEEAKADVKRLVQSVDAGVGRMGSAFSKLKSMGGLIRGGIIGAGVLGGVAMLKREIEEIGQRAKEIKIGTGETGFDAGTFQRVANVLKKNDVGDGALGNSLEATAAAMEKIRNGEDTGGKLAADFAELGVSLDDIKNKRHHEVWLQLAEALKHVEMNERKLGALGNVMGGKAGDMLPAFRDGFDGAAANRGVLSDDDLERAKKLKQLGEEVAGPWKEIKSDVAFAALKMAKVAYDFSGIGTLGNFIGKHIAGEPGAVNPNQGAMEARLAAAAREKAQRQAKAAEADTIRKQLAPKMKEVREKIAAEQDKQATPGERRARVSARLAGLLRERAGLTGNDPETELKREQNRLAILQAQGELRSTRGPGISLAARKADSLGRMGMFTGGGESAIVATELRQQQATAREQLNELRRAVTQLREVNQNLTRTDIGL